MLQRHGTKRRKMSHFHQSSEASATWQSLTREGNRDYARKKLRKAQAHYEEAMEEARSLLCQFQETGLPLSTPVMLVVSCHNLADLFFGQKEPEQAVLFLRHACVELTRLAGLPALPLQARLACVEQLRPAVVSLMEHGDRTVSEQQETQNLVLRARSAALSVYQIAGYAAQTRLEDAPVMGRPS